MDQEPTTEPEPRKRAGVGLRVALVAAGVAAGAIAATALGASATTSGTGSTSSTSSSSSSPQAGTAQPPANAPDGDGRHGGPGGPCGPGGPGGPAPVRPDEKSVSSSDAAKLTAAAKAKVPGATVIRVETDSGDAAYEVHMRKSDGSLVTVKFDKNLAFTAVEEGMGK